MIYDKFEIIIIPGLLKAQRWVPELTLKLHKLAKNDGIKRN